MTVPSVLVNDVAIGDVVLFAGAGLSIDTLGVGAREIRDAVAAEIAQAYPGYDHSSRSLEDVCDEYAAIYDPHRLVNKLAALLPSHVAPSPGHLAAVECFQFILTTNWDGLFERAFDQRGKAKQVLASDAEAPNFSFDSTNLVKLHGTVDRPLTLVATTDQYENYPETHKLLLDQVATLLSQRAVLYVGYGLRDEHIRRVLATIRRTRGVWARKSYAVGKYDEVRTRLLQSRNFEVIQASAQDFLPELAKQLGTPPPAP